MRHWSSPEVSQTLHCNEQYARFSIIKDRVSETLTSRFKKSFEYGIVIGDTQFMFVVNDFLQVPLYDLMDRAEVKRNNHVIIQIDDDYVWDSDELSGWSKQLRDAHEHGYSIIRLYSQDILSERFDWRTRLEKYSRWSMCDRYPVLYLPNRPDKEMIHKTLLK